MDILHRFSAVKYISTFYKHCLYFSVTFCVVFCVHFTYISCSYFDSLFTEKIWRFYVYGFKAIFFSCHFYRESGKILQRFVVCRIKSL